METVCLTNVSCGLQNNFLIPLLFGVGEEERAKSN